MARSDKWISRTVSSWGWRSARTMNSGIRFEQDVSMLRFAGAGDDMRSGSGARGSLSEGAEPATDRVLLAYVAVAGLLVVLLAAATAFAM